LGAVAPKTNKGTKYNSDVTSLLSLVIMLASTSKISLYATQKMQGIFLAISAISIQIVMLQCNNTAARRFLCLKRDWERIRERKMPSVFLKGLWGR
jgi:hypothetical protein